MESPKRLFRFSITLFFWSSKYDRDGEKDQELRCEKRITSKCNFILIYDTTRRDPASRVGTSDPFRSLRQPAL